MIGDLPRDVRLRSLDLALAKAALLVILLFVIGLAFDRPPPDPDYYVYKQEARDFSAWHKTQQKFPPGYPALLEPFSNASPAAQETWAKAIGIVSLAAFGVALLRIAKRFDLVGVCFLVPVIIGNRYSVITALNCTSHMPFAALSAWTFLLAMQKRWTWAYLAAFAAFSMRYNGLILPPFVAIVQIAESRRKLLDFVLPVFFAAVCIAPIAVWLKIGSSAGVETYSNETQKRGTAGFGVAQYVAAGALVSFADETSSEKISGGGRLSKVLFGAAAAVVLGLAVIGLIRFSKTSLLAGLWLIGWLAWWELVHSRFADVGGVYFYSTQTSWVVWLLVLAAVSSWLERGGVLAHLLAVPFVVTAIGGVHSGLAIALALVGWLFFLFRPEKPLAPAAGGCLGLVCLAMVNGWQKVYEENFRPAAAKFLAWAKDHPNVLVSPYMLDQWSADGIVQSGLVSEAAVDGTNLAGSLDALGVRWAAVTSREMQFRSETEFLQGHEFFLGNRYKTPLRPYGLLFPIFKGEKWKMVEQFTERNCWVRIYVRPTNE